MLSMESYDTLRDLSSVNPGTVSRSRRLMDVKRGSGYLKTIDSLAREQWTAYGKSPLIAASVADLSLGPVETTDPQQVSQRRNQDSIFRDKKSKVSFSPSHNNKSLNLNSTGFSGVPQSKGNGYSLISKCARSNCYNTWGSREWDYQDKLIPDAYPRIIVPKQGIVMSRVAKNKDSRRFRTITDFRSRNGTVRIINPPKPLPSIDQPGSVSVVDSFDPETLKREQTYMMLKRIDQLLHPNRFYKEDVTSTEAENRSGISSLAESMDEETNILSNISINRRKNLPNGYEKRLKIKEHINSKSYSSVLSCIVQKLEKSELDSYEKCEQWVDKWFTHSLGNCS